MAKPKSPAVRSDDWKGYVNYNPSEKEKASILEHWSRYDGNYDRAIAELVESGYSVTFTADKIGGVFRCAVTGRSTPCPNIGYTLSIRGSSIERCLAIALFYCSIVCLSGDWLVDKKGGDVW